MNLVPTVSTVGYKYGVGFADFFSFGVSAINATCTFKKKCGWPSFWKLEQPRLIR